MAIPVISIDTETPLFRPGWRAPPVVCLTYDDGTGPQILVGDDVRKFVASTLTRALEGGPHVTSHNACYDFACILSTHPSLCSLIFESYEQGVIYCSKVNEKLLDIAEGIHFDQPRKGHYSLKQVVERRLKISVSKEGTWRLRFGELLGVPLALWPEEAKAYALEDARLHRLLLLDQIERAERMQYSMPNVHKQVRADFALYLTTCCGQRTDPVATRALDGNLTDKMAALQEALIADGLLKVNIGKRSGKTKITKSVIKMREIVSEAFNGHPPRTAPTSKAPEGNIITDGDTLGDLDDPRAERWVEYSGFQKTKTSFVSKFYQGFEMPIHSNYNVLVNTGRTSSFDPNIQQLPRMPGVRECFVARPGYLLSASDFESQEMRCWAQACKSIVGWSVLQERYSRDPDFDPHVSLAATYLMQITEEEALARKKAKDPIVKDFRQKAKIPNFGMPGGLGISGLVGFARGYGERWTMDYARAMINGWKAQWPEQAYYFAHVNAITGFGETGTMEMLFSGRIYSGVSYCAAANAYFQGLAADASKDALWNVVRACFDETRQSPLFGCRPWAFIHDETIVEAPEDRAAEAAEAQRVIMEESMQPWVPDVPARASVALMRRWSKAAEGVRDAGGRLIPWEDRPKKEKGAA